MPMVMRKRRLAHDTRIKGHSYPQAWYEDAIDLGLDAALPPVIDLGSQIW